MKRRSRWLRYGGAAALAALTATAGLLPLTISPASAATITTTRYAGATRYGTAEDIATGVFGTAPTAILATGLNFPDALAASYLAGNLNAPVLLTDPNALSPEAAAALGTLKTANVIVVGGSDAVSDSVVTSLEATASTASAGGNLTVTRISGATRFDTAAAIDSTPAATTVGTFNGKKTAILATGNDFPDALFAGPLSYSSHFPIILTDSATLSPQAATELTSLGIQQVIIMGGTAAVSAAVESAVNAAGVTTLFRSAGATRDDTAAKLLAWELTNISGVDHTSVYLARDDSPDGFADALAMGPAAGKLDLVGGLGAGVPGGGLPTATTTELTAIGAANATAAGTLYIPGGTAAVSAAQAQSASVLLSGTNTAAQTTNPQLVSSKLLLTVTSSQATVAVPAGTYIQYVFSQNVTTAVIKATGFKAYAASGAPDSGVPDPGYIANGAGLDPTNPDAIDAFYSGAAYPALQTAGGAATLTLATVEGPDGLGGPALTIGTAGSPAGNAAIGTAQSGAGQAGKTAAPDLESIGNFRAGCQVNETNPPPCAPGLTAVDFTFDKPAYIANMADAVNSPRFNLVLTSAADPNAPAGAVTTLTCDGPPVGSSSPASGGTVPGGNGTTTLTVICPDIGAGTIPITASQVARAEVDLNAVTSAVSSTGSVTCPAARGAVAAVTGAYCNPTETAVSPHAASLGPDLVSVAIVPLSNGGTSDSVVETFNQPITVTTFADLGYYTSGGAEVPAPALAAIVPNPADSAQISINYPAGSTVAAVGGFAKAMGVTSQNGSHPINAVDALGAANSATTSVAPGAEAAPQLTSAAVLTSTNQFGVASNSVLLIWSQNISGTLPAVPVATLIHAYDADGTEMTCKTTLNGAQGVIASLQANQTVCSAFTLGTAAQAPTAAAPAAGQLAAITLVTVDANYAVGASGTAGAGVPNPEGGVKA